jgi:holo-[acyl-carrier protein] synthase
LKPYSLGVDIEEVDRFRRLVRNPRFMERIYTPAEIAYCSAKKNSLQHFAVRFAAKEAVWKALSEAIRRTNKPVAHREISVRNDAHGRPEVVLPDTLKRFRKKISLSLSHSRNHVVAVALVAG